MPTIATELGNVLDSGLSVSNPTDITVYFVPENENWSEQGRGTFTSNGWSAYEIQQAMSALQEFSAVANLSFSQTTDAEDATFTVSTRALGTNLFGYFYLPSTSENAGIGAFNDSVSSWTTGGLQKGGFSYMLFLHEFAHGLGLEHPHADSDAHDSFPGVVSSTQYGDFDLNQGINTVMTYNSGWRTHPEGQLSSSIKTYGYSGTPMAIDIAVLQNIYGANTTYQSGDSTYQLFTSNGTGTNFSTIWDTGGTDTIVNNSVINSTIDLRPASLQVVENGGGFVSYAQSIYGGYTIAADVIIENAIGGASDDTIVGNAADNTLTGQNGDDVIQDSLGNDTLSGGDGNDVLINGSGIGTLSGGNGIDLLLGGNQADVLDGGAGRDIIRGDQVGAISGGSDKITGGTGNDYLMGGLGADEFIFKPDDGEDVIASFSVSTHDPIALLPIVPEGPDFVPGLDKVVLDGFSQSVQNDPLAFTTVQNNSTVFAAEQTEITFFSVTGLTADDFEFI